MDCHEVRLLLALERRSGDTLDPTERAALQHHLDACPDCTAMTRSEQVIDTAFGTAMRAVAVPASARTRTLAKLQATAPRRWPKVAAAAAVLLALLTGAGVWLNRALPRVDSQIAYEAINERHGTPPDDVEAWYRKNGIETSVWRQLDYQHLWWFDIEEFQGRRVPKLVFYNRDNSALAEVIVLAKSEFDTSDLQSMPHGTPNLIRVLHVVNEKNQEFVYLIGSYQNSLDTLMLQPN